MFRKIRSTIREIGYFPTITYAIDRLIKGVAGNRAHFNLCHFVAQPVPTKRLLPEGAKKPITVRPIEFSDLNNAELPLTRDLLDERKNNGVMCLGAFDGGNLVGFHCFSFGAHDDEMYRARFKVGPEGRAVWDFDIFILPSYRGGITFVYLWDGVFDFLRERDICWLTSYISATNTTSLKSHLRMGSVKLGSAIFLRLSGLQVIWSTRPPYFHISLAKFTKPTFSLNAPETS